MKSADVYTLRVSHNNVFCRVYDLVTESFELYACLLEFLILFLKALICMNFFLTILEKKMIYCTYTPKLLPITHHPHKHYES